jgi:large subunit ribosomal protein L20
MPRVKTGTVRRARHKKTLKRAKGYWGLRSISPRVANQTLLNGGEYQRANRRDRKNDFRSLWITRINAAVRQEGLSYSVFMSSLRKQGVDINRKVLADLAVNQPEAFKQLVATAKSA